MSAHTPGPWKAGRTQGGSFGVWATSAQYNVLDASALGINAEANARLIAAAPELLSALQRLLSAFETDANRAPEMTIIVSYETNSQALAQARAAIAKAISV